MSIKTFCDVCNKELTRNMVDDRLVVEQGHFKAEVIVDKDGTSNDGDLCHDCLIKMLTLPLRKPRKLRSDAGTHRTGIRLKPEPVTIITPGLQEMEEGLNSEGLTLLKEPEPVPQPPKRTRKRKQVKVEELVEVADKKGDNLTIHVPTGMGKDTEYKVNIAGSEATGPESLGIRVVVLAALEEFNGKIPDCLDDYERKTIQGILDAGK